MDKPFAPPSFCITPIRLSTFSTMMSEPSTTSPKSMAPRLMRFALWPVSHIPMNANIIASGITLASTSPARRLTSRIRSTTMTSSAPSARCLPTVPMVRFTSDVRS